MNRVLIVFYDLTEPQNNREAVIRKIKSHGFWARLGTAAYLICTNATPVSVRDGIMPLLRKGDRIFVGVASRPSAWRGLPEEVSKWILKNQV